MNIVPEINFSSSGEAQNSKSQCILKFVNQFGDRLWDESEVIKKLSLKDEYHKRFIDHYLASVHELVSNTPVQLKNAIEVSKQRGFVELAEFFALKLTEEQGHDLWAASDMSHHKVSDSSSKVVPGIGRILARNKQRMSENPANYLVYVFFAESITVKLGERILNLIQTLHGVAPESLSVVSKHVELDVEHVQHDILAMDQQLHALISFAELEETLLSIAADVRNFFDELANV
jgi:hypothetical protein